jgi:hypothetical protein
MGPSYRTWAAFVVLASIAMTASCRTGLTVETAGSGGSGAAGDATGTGGVFGTGGADGTGGAPGTGGAGNDSACTTADDCAWGELGRDILGPKDCPCLYGCPSRALNKATIERRNLQYKANCRPGFNGDGVRCPIDDCIMPPPLSCTNNTCLAAPRR